MDRHENNLLCQIYDGLASNGLRSVSSPNLSKLARYQQQQQQQQYNHHLSLGVRSRSFSHMEEIYHHLVFNNYIVIL